jgi:hypothetical protein
VAKKKPKDTRPPIVMILDEGIPKLVKNSTGCTVEVRDYDPSDCDDDRLKTDKDTGEKYFEYRWPNGRVDKG